MIQKLNCIRFISQLFIVFYVNYEVEPKYSLEDVGLWLLAGNLVHPHKLTS